DADRPPVRVDQAPARTGNRRALYLRGPSGEVSEPRDRTGYVVSARRNDGLAAVEAVELGEHLPMLLHQVGDPVQTSRPFGSRKSCPLAEAPARRRDCELDVVTVSARSDRDLAPRYRILHADRRAGTSKDELIADEHPQRR